MKIVSALSEVKASPLLLTFGNFDGVHQGHQKLIKDLVKEKKETGATLVLCTFIPHPRKVITPELKHFLIYSYAQRRSLLQQLGVDYLVEIPFNIALRNKEAQDFLKNDLGAIHSIFKIKVGNDFSFGKDKLGSLKLLQDFCEEYKIKLEQEDAFCFEGKKISSTLIREYLSQGDVHLAGELLGHPYFVQSEVVKGESKGTKIGFPTANFVLDEDLIYPASGVYVTQTLFENKLFYSVTHIGDKPTWNQENKIFFETHILDFSEDIYAKNIKVTFYKKIRDVMKFSSVEELCNQIKKDIFMAREFFR